MRKLGAALLAVPVLVVVYLASLGRRGMFARLVTGTAVAAVIALLVVAGTPPSPSAAVPVSVPRPVSADLFMAIGTSHAVTAPFTIGFDAPMDAATVAGALSIEPRGGFALRWDGSGRILAIAPIGHWRPDTLYRITVDTSARSMAGGILEVPVRSVVLTSRAGDGSVTATRRSSTRVRLDTTFSIRLDRPMTIAAVRAALRTEPSVAGDVVRGDAAGTWTFRPFASLAPDTAYAVRLEGLVDADGVPFTVSPGVIVRTIAAPDVVRFRPQGGKERIHRTATLSVRFSQPMEKARTAAALHVVAAGKPVAGTIAWTADATVLVFTPSKALPYDAYVTQRVDLSARSRAGAPVQRVEAETFRVERKPAVAKAKPKPSGGTVSIPHTGGGGGGGAVSGSWLAVERYYLQLMNCTRTGGWVTSTGGCSSPGGRSVARLDLSSAISGRVSRPYAKLLATRNECSHFIGGNPGDRLRRAGFTSYRWAENLGCRSGGAYSAVLGSHLFFQSEKSYNGGHYRNLMNADYDRVGIGVWVSGGRVRLVIDFYHP